MGWQRAQIALAAQRLGLRVADEFLDVGYSGMSIDRPGLRRPLRYPPGQVLHRRHSRPGSRKIPDDAADIGQALSDALVAIVAAADHTGPVPALTQARDLPERWMLAAGRKLTGREGAANH